MRKTRYILTDDYTANLAELLQDKLVGFELLIKEVNEKVCTLNNLQNSLQLFTEKQTAEILSISVRGLITLRNEQKIHYRQIGTSIRYSMEDIKEFQESCRR